MGSHTILKSRLAAVAKGDFVSKPDGDLLLGLKGTPNFKFMGLSASYGWYRRFATPSEQREMADATRQRLLDCFDCQQREFMLEEQCAPDPHFEFYLAPVGVAGVIGALTSDQAMLQRVERWLGGFMWVYRHGLGVNSRDPKKRLLFVPGFRTLLPNGRASTDPTSAVADSLYRLLYELPFNRAEEKEGYWGDGGVKNLGLFTVRGLVDKGLIHPKPAPVGLIVPTAWKRIGGNRIVARLVTDRPLAGVGPCYWLDANLSEGRVTAFSTDWDVKIPETISGGEEIVE